MRRGGLTLLAVLVAACAALAPPALAQGTSSNPPPPPGSNDACRPDQDPTPLVLVHGTLASRQEFFFTAPQLEAAHFCTFALNYGGCTQFGSCGRGRIQDSAAELRRFIDRTVLPHSRTGKVSILGHSQGGLMPRYYLKFLGGRTKVRDMVSFSGSNHGTNNPLAPFGPRGGCFACLQQFPYQGAFPRQVNAGDETLAGIDYTQIQTRFDDTVIPYFSAYLAERPGTPNGPRTTRLNGPNTTNFCLQDQYPLDVSEHNDIESDTNAIGVAIDALRRAGPAAKPDRPDSVCARLGGDPGGGRSANGQRPPCTIRGTGGDDVLLGTNDDDVICAGGGDDVVRGRGGNDYVYGGDGNDTLRGDAGADHLFGEGGADTVNSSDGVRGNDSVDGGAGSRDVCNGDPGDRRSACP
jgi:triacylglycerol lipase